MRLIDANALMELYADSKDFSIAMCNVPIPIIRQNILDMPTIDAVKVTRCKNCKLSYTPVHIPAGETQPVVIARFCGMTNRLVKDDGYCDEAIPKED